MRKLQRYQNLSYYKAHKELRSLQEKIQGDDCLEVSVVRLDQKSAVLS